MNDSKICVACGKSGRIHQHHLSYTPEVTIPLCVSCHRKIHQHPLNIPEKYRREIGNSVRGGFYMSPRDFVETAIRRELYEPTSKSIITEKLNRCTRLLEEIKENELKEGEK